MSSSPSKFAPQGGNLFSWVCTKNPFYAISAALELWGLWLSFGKQTEELETWLLMGGLAGYTLLLAGTAFFLVRFLKLWDDARTVLLLVVLMFLATSVTFDHVLVIEPERGTACYILGLGLAIMISEALLGLLELRLPLLYRLPYYLILALFFLYPIFVREMLDPEHPIQEPVMWALFGFSTAAGLVFLTLLPALRRGPKYVQGNGSPWPWPLYPWSLFGILALAVPGRAILMCWSLHSLGPALYDRLVFGPYFLVPFGFALTVLLLEMGLVASRKKVLQFALAMPLFLMGLALVGHHPGDPIYQVLRILTTPMGEYSAFGKVRTDPDPVYAKFLEIFSHRLGADPLFYTLGLSACFYGYAASRRVALAVEGLAMALAAMAFVATNSLSEGLLVPPEPGLLLAPAALWFFLGLGRRNPWDLLLGAVCLAGAVALAIPLPLEMIPDLRGGIFIHLVILAMLVLGAGFRDHAGLFIRRLGTVGFLLLALAVMNGWTPLPEIFLPWAPIAYPLMVGILLAAYGHLLRDSLVLLTATAILGICVFKFGWAGYRSVRGLLKGFDFLVCGLGFFVVAVLVSLGKSGRLNSWFESRWLLRPWMRQVPALQPFHTPPMKSPGSAPFAPNESQLPLPEE